MRTRCPCRACTFPSVREGTSRMLRCFRWLEHKPFLRPVHAYSVFGGDAFAFGGPRAARLGAIDTGLFGTGKRHFLELRREPSMKPLKYRISQPEQILLSYWPHAGWQFVIRL